MIDEDSSAGWVNTCFQEQSRQGVTQSTGYNTGFIGNGNVFFHRGGNGGNGVPQMPPWIGLDFRFILKSLVLWARSEAIGFAFCKMQR